jgi:hypothetical protein
MRNLFRFENAFNKKNVSGSPRLIPSGSGRGLFSSLSQNFLKNDSLAASSDGLIDVVNDFHWTSSKLTSRQDIPAVLLKEQRLKTNALAMQLAYYALVVSERGGEISGRIGNLLSNSKLASGALNGFFNSGIGKSIAGIGDKILGAASSFGNGVLGSGIGEFFTGKSPSELLDQFTGQSSSSSVLNSYAGLYITEETKFVYRLPYFENTAYNLTNAFADDDHILTSGAIGAGFKQLADVTEQALITAAQATGMSEPGIYIEKPQFYAFGTNGQTESLTIRFPLINTGWATFEDVQRNWQLLYMLVYQNRPNRKTRDLVDPPCIYEVMIPGVKFMPYAFISGMKVDFLGARRSYHINVPNKNNGTTKIQTIIPDAYNVTITLKSLVTETQNFLYHMLFEKQDIVNVIETSGNNLVGNLTENLKKQLRGKKTQDD